MTASGNLVWAWSDVTKECMDGIQKKILKRFPYDLRGFAKHEEVAKINMAVVEMASTFNLGVDEGDIEELLEIVLEEQTNEQLLELELEQEHVAEEEARERNTAGQKEYCRKKKKDPLPPPQENSQ